MTTGVEVSKPSMEIRFQPALLQEVIDSFIEKTERGPESADLPHLLGEIGTLTPLSPGSDPVLIRC